MLKERVDTFNFIVGNPPVGTSDKEKFWTQIQLQAQLVLEEAQEMYDAAMAKDFVEVVDGYSDVNYTNTYMETLIDSVKVPTALVNDLVSLNNAQKYTRVKGMAIATLNDYTSKGVEVFVEEVDYQGTTYFTVRRTSDTKVMKLLRHVNPDLLTVIPKDLLSRLVD